MNLKIDGLSFSFGQRRVLKDISLEVSDGEFVGLMGPNGSGKTTMLRCLTRFLPSESRAVLVDMKPLHTLTDREVASIFAVVPQSSSTDFPFTGRDIVSMGRLPHMRSRLSGTRKGDLDAVQNALDITGAAHLADRAFFQLSGGERQRIVIARALAQEPAALLLDEPTVYLDISGQLDMMDLIKRLNKEKSLTIFAVLHDINLAARYCDRIALLNQGRLEIIGSPSEVLTPEMIQSVYGVEVAVRRDPFTSSIYVMPRTISTSVARHGTRVHLLCGGGSGGPLMKTLFDNGYSVSTGVLNVLDSDYEIANELHIPVVAEVPFAQISDEAHMENLRLLNEASFVIVSPFPVGPGNFKNLEAAENALVMGKRVVVIMPSDAGAIDFVGGKATTFVKNLISRGAYKVSTVEEALGSIRS
ncbi:MAG: ABC transporter ATP-binding protein [Candidatus Thermoplasmatota archaeon]|nr:ABC transporter ATP-binding protein [Candidatus Thermoplasmatota archaeon]